YHRGQRARWEVEDEIEANRVETVDHGLTAFLETADAFHGPNCGGHSTHSSPSGPISFFQTGTSTLSRSIAYSQASNACFRWGVPTAMTTLASPIANRPVRWVIATCW